MRHEVVNNAILPLPFSMVKGLTNIDGKPRPGACLNEISNHVQDCRTEDLAFVSTFNNLKNHGQSTLFTLKRHTSGYYFEHIFRS